jgi:hypothetical protein
MGKLISMLMNALRALYNSRWGTWIASALAWLGLSFGTHAVAIGPAIELLENYMTGAGGGELGGVAIGWMGVLKFDVGISMFISAVTIRNAIVSSKVFLRKRGA